MEFFVSKIIIIKNIKCLTMNKGQRNDMDKYFYIEDGNRVSIVAIYKNSLGWLEGRILKGIKPRDWGKDGRCYTSLIEAKDEIIERYDHAEFLHPEEVDSYMSYVH